jgi:LacI family transcriptional regulator
MKPNGNKVSLTQIAKLAGVSVASVSRFLNDASSVSVETRSKVNAAITDLGDFLGSASFSRKFNTRRVLGLVVPDIGNPFFPSLIQGIESVTKIRGYDILLCDSEEDPQLEVHQLHRLIEIGTSGLIYVPNTMENVEVQKAVERFTPIVFLDRVFDWQNICSVTADNTEGALQATRYLTVLGHTEFIYITRPLAVSSIRDRYAGFCQALDEKGISVDRNRVITVDNPEKTPTAENYYFEKARTEVSNLLKAEFPFTAVFATDDVMAVGAKKAIEERGLSVPQDISIIGYDDILISQISGLTTVSQPTYEMGRNAAILVLDLIEGRVRPPKRIQLNASLVIRNSCRRIP